MTRRLLLLLAMTTVLLSCGQSKFEKLLTNPDKKWSYIPNPHNHHMKMAFYVKFLKGGEFETRFLSDDQEHLLVDGQKVTSAWTYNEDDKVLHIANKDYRLLSHNDDTIHLLATESNRKIMFINRNVR